MNRENRDRQRRRRGLFVEPSRKYISAPSEAKYAAPARLGILLGKKF
jgi:hypothetical protein